MPRSRAAQQPSLQMAQKFLPAREFLDGHGNLACFVDTQGLKWALHKYAVYWAEIQSMIDFEAERKKVRAEVLRQEYPKYAGAENLPASVEAELIAKVDERMVALSKKRDEETIPKLTEEFRKYLAWIDLFNSVTFSVNVNLNDFDFKVRVSTLLSE